MDRGGLERVRAALEAAGGGGRPWTGPVHASPRVLVDRLRAALFPAFRGGRRLTTSHLSALAREADRLARAVRIGPAASAGAVLVGALPGVLGALSADARAIVDRDPAATSLDEVVLAYPGFLALVVHRAAHALHLAGLPLLPRLLAEHAHERTGVDIHPGASIGPGLCIDHGTGIVIGETAEIGSGVTLYQGVTLGALRVSRDQAGRKRHPTIEDGVTIYANATILGGRTVVGRGSVIGGNVFVTESVPPGSVVGHAPSATVRRRVGAGEGRTATGRGSRARAGRRST